MLWSKLVDKKRIGAKKEQQAKDFLLKQGYQLIERNFPCRYGEIDLIMTEPTTNTLVFVEVRYRKSQKFGGAAASVTLSKQNKIKKAALFYLSQRKIDCNIRFDVIAFEQEQLNWHQSAFS